MTRSNQLIQLSNLSLLHLTEELDFLVNGFINNIQTLENNWIKIKIHTKEFGDKQLIISPNLVFVSNYSLPAKQNPGGYSSFLKKHLYNQRIIQIEQLNLDRILKITFPNNILVIELFAKGNLILCDNQNKIIRAYKKEEWRDRKIEVGEEYKPPSSKGVNPLKETITEFKKKIESNEKTLFGATVDLLNASPQLLEFVFEQEKINKTQPAKKTNETTIKLILTQTKKIYSTKKNKSFLLKNTLYPIKISEECIEFESTNFALNKLLKEELNQNVIEKKARGNDEEELIQKGNKIEKNLRNLKHREEQVKELELESEELQKKGELIYLKYNELLELIQTIKLGEEKGYKSKEIKNKINSVKPIIKELDLKKNRLVVDYTKLN